MQRVTKCNEVDALLLVEKERLDVLAKKLSADLEDSIARKHALDELEVVLKELESKVKSARCATLSMLRTRFLWKKGLRGHMNISITNNIPAL